MYIFVRFQSRLHIVKYASDVVLENQVWEMNKRKREKGLSGVCLATRAVKIQFLPSIPTSFKWTSHPEGRELYRCKRPRCGTLVTTVRNVRGVVRNVPPPVFRFFFLFFFFFSLSPSVTCTLGHLVSFICFYSSFSYSLIWSYSVTCTSSHSMTCTFFI